MTPEGIYLIQCAIWHDENTVEIPSACFVEACNQIKKRLPTEQFAPD